MDQVEEKAERRCRCGGAASAIKGEWRLSNGLPAGTTWTYRCTSCGHEFTIHPVALMFAYQLLITGVGAWLIRQALQLEDPRIRNPFLGIAVAITLCAVPLWWVSLRRLRETRQHPEVAAPR